MGTISIINIFFMCFVHRAHNKHHAFHIVQHAFSHSPTCVSTLFVSTPLTYCELKHAVFSGP